MSNKPCQKQRQQEQEYEGYKAGINNTLVRCHHNDHRGKKQMKNQQQVE